MKTQITITLASTVLIMVSTILPGNSQLVPDQKLTMNQCLKQGAKNKSCSLIKDQIKTIYNPPVNVEIGETGNFNPLII